MVDDESPEAKVKIVLAAEMHDPLFAAFIRRQP